jgi:uncharacterized LabA/DUF88 family protein
MNQTEPSEPKSKPRRSRNRRPKTQGNYAFIDSQNLNLGVQKIGWKMDWRKFRLWLQEKYGVTHAYMFIGYMAENESLYELMHDHGYLIVLKPTLEIKPDANDEEHKDDKPTIKGNIDADLVLHAMKELRNYDKAVIVSGDGDFFGLIEYLAEQKKLLKILTPNQRYSTLLKGFEEYIDGIDQHRGELAYRDHRTGRKPAPRKSVSDK